MTAISVREITPIAGKTDVLKSRILRAVNIMSRHGANAWATQVLAGEGAGDFHIYGGYKNFTDAAKAFTSFSKDSEMLAVQQERETDQAGHMRGPWIGRLMFGSPTTGTDMPISVHRDFHMPRSSIPAVMELAPKFANALEPMGVEMAIGVQLMGHDHEMVRSIYRFSSIEHWGDGVDKMLSNEELQSLFKQAGELGTLKTSRMMTKIS